MWSAEERRPPFLSMSGEPKKENRKSTTDAIAMAPTTVAPAR